MNFKVGFVFLITFVEFEVEGEREDWRTPEYEGPGLEGETSMLEDMEVEVEDSGSGSGAERQGRVRGSAGGDP